MSVAQELQDAARAIRRSTPPDATFHRAAAALLDQLALSAPHVEIHLPPITRRALDMARAFTDPAGEGRTSAGSAARGAAPARAVEASSTARATSWDEVGV